MIVLVMGTLAAAEGSPIFSASTLEGFLRKGSLFLFAGGYEKGYYGCKGQYMDCSHTTCFHNGKLLGFKIKKERCLVDAGLTVLVRAAGFQFFCSDGKVILFGEYFQFSG